MMGVCQKDSYFFLPIYIVGRKRKCYREKQKKRFVLLIQQDNTDVAGQIEELNGKIRELVEQNSPRLVRGKILYDEIKKRRHHFGMVERRLQMFHRLLQGHRLPLFLPHPEEIRSQPTTPSSSSSTRWAWTTATSVVSWASPKRPSTPQDTGFNKV